ncbi:MAG: amino acid adenylation domain-containing protein [Flavobacteriales bacterium]
MEKFTPTIKLVPVDFDPFEGTPIVRTVPSTETQREVFVTSSMGPDASCAYNESVSLELTGALDVAALERAIDALVQRHEGLRSVMAANGLRVIVQETSDVPLRFIDLRNEDEAGRERELERLAEADATTPFDLVHGPLFRVHLVRLAENKHLLRLTGHHLVCDGWSLGIIMADISKLYSGAPLEPAVPFSAYALATMDFQHSPAHTQVERYWLDQFKGPLPQLDLPTDRPRPKQKTYNGHRIDVPMDPALVRGLKDVATRNGASFVTTLLTGFELLLHRITGDSDIVVGLPAAGQSDMGMKQLVAHCVNLLALRSRIDDERPFAEHLKERRTAVLDAFDNQKYTFGTLVRRLNVPREAGRIPLVPAVFNIDMNMDDGVAFTGLQHRFISNPRRFENFELFLNATGSEHHLTLEWSYNTDLFDERTIRHWMDEFTAIIRNIIADPRARIANVIGASVQVDRHAVPAEWVGGDRPYPSDKSISTLFDDVVAAAPDAPALVYEDTSLTYAQLRERVLALAGELQVHGVQRGDRVAICLDRGFDLITAELAAVRTGAIYVPLDRSYPADRLAFMLQDCSARVLVTRSDIRAELEVKDVPVLLTDVPRKDAAAFSGAPMDAPDQAAHILYTSGSTGIPKGVLVPHRGIIRLVRDQNYFRPDGRLVVLQQANIAFDASTFEIWAALLNGGTLVLQPEQKPTLDEIGRAIERHSITTALFPTGLFNLLVDEQLDRIKQLRWIFTGGDVMSVTHVRKALTAMGPGRIVNLYGPTENSVVATWHAVDEVPSTLTAIPIGKAIHNSSLHVLDTQQRPVGVGGTGELYVGGDGVALGYWDRAELTAERFIPDSFSTRPGARLYRTGDLVRWSDKGELDFIGRADDQVKVRGFRIEPGEIESVIGELPEVRSSAVIVRSDMPGGKQLVAYLVPGDAAAVDGAQREEAFVRAVREHLRERLPEHMLPTGFMALQQLPLTPNGKVDKRALPSPNHRLSTMRAEHVAPRDANERTIAGIWSDLLGVDDIGIHDNFFDLGGHSLTGIQVLGRIDEAFGRSLSLKALFQAPTIAELAQLLRADPPARELTNLSAIQPEGNELPLFCVHGDEANHFIPRYLGHDRPFYAFFHQGEDGKPIRYTAVEDIAAHFISEMRTVRPSGPYLLCGYSFGGIVAYEMARQLMAAGEEVPFLGLFDSYAPDDHMRVMREDKKWYDEMKKRVMRMLVRRTFARGKELSLKLRHFHIIDTYDRSIRDYRPKPYSGKITMFKADASRGVEDMGWARFGHVDVEHIPGDHYSMIKEPMVRTLVAKLAASIGRSLQRPAGAVRSHA